MCDDSIRLLSESEADKRAVSELEKQLKNQSGIKAELTKAKIKELKTQINAEKKMKQSLQKSRKAFTKNLKKIVKRNDPASLLSLNNNDMNQLTLNFGYAESVDEFIEQSEKIAEASKATASLINPDLTFDQRQLRIIDAAKTAATQRIFDALILPKLNSGVREALVAMTLEVPINQAMSSLAQSFEQAEKRQLTEINTQIASYGRTITASIADAAGLKYFLYTGPQDGLTRKFCDPLVNKVVSQEQMNDLNNGQGLAVKTSGGGYNCRHSWSPVTEGFIQAAKLDKATSQDIQAANNGAKRR